MQACEGKATLRPASLCVIMKQYIVIEDQTMYKFCLFGGGGK
jgi:hypothetical protein